MHESFCYPLEHDWAGEARIIFVVETVVNHHLNAIGITTGPSIALADLEIAHISARESAGSAREHQCAVRAFWSCLVVDPCFHTGRVKAVSASCVSHCRYLVDGVHADEAVGLLGSKWRAIGVCQIFELIFVGEAAGGCHCDMWNLVVLLVIEIYALLAVPACC